MTHPKEYIQVFCCSISRFGQISNTQYGKTFFDALRLKKNEEFKFLQFQFKKASEGLRIMYIEHVRFTGSYLLDFLIDARQLCLIMIVLTVFF